MMVKGKRPPKLTVERWWIPAAFTPTEWTILLIAQCGCGSCFQVFVGYVYMTRRRHFYSIIPFIVSLKVTTQQVIGETFAQSADIFCCDVSVV